MCVCVFVYLIEINHRQDHCHHISCLTERKRKIIHNVSPTIIILYFIVFISKLNICQLNISGHAVRSVHIQCTFNQLVSQCTYSLTPCTSVRSGLYHGLFLQMPGRCITSEPRLSKSPSLMMMVALLFYSHLTGNAPQLYSYYSFIKAKMVTVVFMTKGEVSTAEMDEGNEVIT